MAYQNKNLEYIDAVAYDNRGESSILEKYVLGLWQPFLKNKVSELSVGKIVVDLGCGTGEYAASAAGAKKIYAIDTSEEMLKICREKLKDRPKAEIIKASVLDINLPVADLVIAIGVLEYINPEKLFNKISEITEKGSKVIVVFPNIYNDLNWMRSLARARIVALRPGFIKKLFSKDFKLIEAESFGNIFWFPKKFQSLVLPVWKFSDLIWRPFQKFLPLGVNTYYLFEKN